MRQTLALQGLTLAVGIVGVGFFFLLSLPGNVRGNHPELDGFAP